MHKKGSEALSQQTEGVNEERWYPEKLIKQKSFDSTQANKEVKEESPEI